MSMLSSWTEAWSIPKRKDKAKRLRGKFGLKPWERTQKAEFNAFAEEWDKSRQQPSTALKFFLPHAKGKVLDAGCGNGRNAEVLAETSEVCAIDVSPKMVSLAKKRLGKKAEVERADLKKLPFEDKAFDAVFCLAVLHHFSPKEQGKALKETERVLKKDGFLCLAVWNRCQKRFRNKPKELNVPWGEHERYYYLFDETELIALLEKNGFRTTELFYEKNGRKEEREKAQNLCVAAKKR